jgi:hypothetical protein
MRLLPRYPTSYPAEIGQSVQFEIGACMTGGKTVSTHNMDASNRVGLVGQTVSTEIKQPPDEN